MSRVFITHPAASDVKVLDELLRYRAELTGAELAGTGLADAGLAGTEPPR